MFSIMQANADWRLFAYEDACVLLIAQHLRQACLLLLRYTGELASSTPPAHVVSDEQQRARPKHTLRTRLLDLGAEGSLPSPSSWVISHAPATLHSFEHIITNFFPADHSILLQIVAMSNVDPATVAGAILIVLDILTVASRFYLRWFIKAGFGWDDWIILIAILSGILPGALTIWGAFSTSSLHSPAHPVGLGFVSLPTYLESTYLHALGEKG